MLVEIYNGFIDMLNVLANFALALLPDSPFQFNTLSWGSFGDLIGFMFPISDMFAHMTVIISAFLVYYAVRWLLRVVKQIN